MFFCPFDLWVPSNNTSVLCHHCGCASTMGTNSLLWYELSLTAGLSFFHDDEKADTEIPVHQKCLERVAAWRFRGRTFYCFLNRFWLLRRFAVNPWAFFSDMFGIIQCTTRFRVLESLKVRWVDYSEIFCSSSRSSFWEDFLSYNGMLGAFLELDYQVCLME